MPQLGDIKTAREIGYKTYPSNKYIWHACIDCGKERWVPFVKSKPQNLRCHPCGGKVHPAIFWGPDNPNWKGGRRTGRDSYRRVRVYKNDFFYPMADKDGYIAEHRLIMAKYLRRCLLPWEVVHHKNGIKNDNRLENLKLYPTGRQHLPDSILRSQIKRLRQDITSCQQRITLLEAENALLRAQLLIDQERKSHPAGDQAA